MKYLAVLALTFSAANAAAQVDSAAPFRIPVTGLGGASYGDVIVGTSQPADVERVLVSVGGLGPKRENRVTFTIGTTKLHPSELYTPPATMNQLYFDGGVLVLVVEGIPRGLPTTRSAFLTAFPAAKETHRESGWYELQVQVRDCLWLIAVFGVADDKLESDGYAYTCGKS
ncbi:MAG TPA: hypothetical protein VFM10_06570 [Terriglobales bacterium]|nr:hypothetical protein [Terriglobales bacterium]